MCIVICIGKHHGKDKYQFQERREGDFPGGSVAETLSSQCRGAVGKTVLEGFMGSEVYLEESQVPHRTSL